MQANPACALGHSPHACHCVGYTQHHGGSPGGTRVEDPLLKRQQAQKAREERAVRREPGKNNVSIVNITPTTVANTVRIFKNSMMC